MENSIVCYPYNKNGKISEILIGQLNELIILCSDFCSAQWPIDGVGVRYLKPRSGAGVLYFYVLESMASSSFFIDQKRDKALIEFLKKTGFHVEFIDDEGRINEYT